jgi:hypothetical protein
MALNDTQLDTDLTTLFDATIGSAGSADDAKRAFIVGLRNAIKAYVKSGQIVYTNGLSAGSTPVAGTFNGRIQ